MRLNPNLITRAVKRNNLNVADTAKQLGIHKSTVYRWVKRSNSEALDYKTPLEVVKLLQMS